MGMKPCPVAGCGRRCSDEFLMCRSDWSRVSRETQQEVYATFRAYQAEDPIRAEADRWRAVRDAYRSARDEAIRQAEESRARALAKAIERP